MGRDDRPRSLPPAFLDYSRCSVRNRIGQVPFDSRNGPSSKALDMYVSLAAYQLSSLNRVADWSAQRVYCGPTRPSRLCEIHDLSRGSTRQPGNGFPTALPFCCQNQGDKLCGLPEFRCAKSCIFRIRMARRRRWFVWRISPIFAPKAMWSPTQETAPRRISSR